jgi:hypothetical protein
MSVSYSALIIRMWHWLRKISLYDRGYEAGLRDACAVVEERGRLIGGAIQPRFTVPVILALSRAPATTRSMTPRKDKS